MMKKIFLASLVVFFLLGAAAPASALTVADLQSQIQTLLARIVELQAQIRERQASNSNANNTTTDVTSLLSTDVSNAPLPRICQMRYARPLSVGVSGDFVTGLQEFLQSEGLMSVSATGYFGSLTQTALRRFQSEHDVVSSGTAATTGWGVLGPRTWSAIQKWCQVPTSRFSVSPQRGVAPLTATFKTNIRLSNPSMIADAGSYKIVFGDGTEHIFTCTGSEAWCDGPHAVTHTYTADGTYAAKLVHFGFFGPADETINGVTVAERTVYVGDEVACTEEYAPVCASKQVVCVTTPCNPTQQTYSNRCKASVDGATFLYEGQCRSTTDPSLDRTCKSWYDGCNNCFRATPDSPAACTLRACFVQGPAYCTTYFGDTEDNNPPTISSFSGPTILAAKHSGTWTIQASDPDGQALSYHVSWGDTLAHATPATLNADNTFVQTTTFTHSYSKAGTYEISVIVRDSGGKEAKTSTTVQVYEADTTACTTQYDPVCGLKQVQCITTPCYPVEQTYSNICLLEADSATLKHTGACEGFTACTADAYLCSDGTWVGRTGSQCEFVCPSGSQ